MLLTGRCLLYLSLLRPSQSKLGLYFVWGRRWTLGSLLPSRFTSVIRAEATCLCIRACLHVPVSGRQNSTFPIASIPRCISLQPYDSSLANTGIAFLKCIHIHIHIRFHIHSNNHQENEKTGNQSRGPKWKYNCAHSSVSLFLFLVYSVLRSKCKSWISKPAFAFFSLLSLPLTSNAELRNYAGACSIILPARSFLF